MEVHLLGALEVVDADGARLPVPGARLRTLLAVLALDVGQVVAADRIVEALWGDAAPRGATNSLQGLVSRLRKALGGAERVAMRANGYVLDLDPDDVDVVRFERWAAEGREAAARGELELAVARLVDADGIWRGSPLSDFMYDEFAQPAIARLSELRIASIEERVGAQLTLGSANSLVTDLEALVAAHPLRERLRGYLMQALYRDGRQADALRVFQEGRHILGEELGLEPGVELRRLESAVLAHDPSLDAAVHAPAARPSAPGRGRTNIRVPLASLIGREKELQDLTQLLGAHRLVTVVGPGGAGKTRIAVEVAQKVAEKLDDGAWFVDLAPIEDPVAIVTAITQALGVPEAPGAEPAGHARLPGLTRVGEFLAHKQMLLVLDNCEHVITEAAHMATELLGSCPSIAVLATSREPLRLPGEVVWPIPPLGLDDAIDLFSERAKAVDSTITATEDALPVVSDICRQLDGLPLAIELAAARTRAFPLAQISTRLDDRFRLLTAGARTALPRQQTLRAVVDWSYDLLFEDERRVFERLSVFPGGATLDAAEAVCAHDELEAADVSDLIATLVDKSLVIADHSAPEPRYRLLQTLAQYGRDRLRELGDTDATRERMTAYFAACCLRGRPALTGTDQPAWLATVRAEIDNLRAALDCAIERSDAERAVLISGALCWYFWLAGRAREGCRWLDAAFTCDGEAAPATRAFALMWRAYLGYLADGPGPSDAFADEAIAIYRELRDDVGLGMSLYVTSSHILARGEIARGLELLRAAREAYDRAPDDPWMLGGRAYVRSEIAQFEGDPQEAEARLLEAIAHYRPAGDMWGTAAGLLAVAAYPEQRGDFREARLLLEEALELTRELSLPGLEATLLSKLGNVNMLDDDLDLAERVHDESLELGRRLAYPPVVARALNGVAVRLRLQGRFSESERAAREALEIYRARNRPVGPDGRSRYVVPAGAASALITLGHLAAHRGDLPDSIRLHEEGIAEARLSGDRLTLATALEGLAGAVALQGDAERAAELLGEASHWTSTPRSPAEVREIERIAAAVISAVGRDAFDRAFEAGLRGALTR